MTRWLITAATQPELPFDKKHLNVYYFSEIREISFWKEAQKIRKLKNKNFSDIYNILYDRLNKVSENILTDKNPTIEAYSVEEAIKIFISNDAVKGEFVAHKLYDITIEEANKDNYHELKDGTEQQYLVCPLVSLTKLYNVSDFDALVKALTSKFYYSKE